MGGAPGEAPGGSRKGAIPSTRTLRGQSYSITGRGPVYVSLEKSRISARSVTIAMSSPVTCAPSVHAAGAAPSAHPALASGLRRAGERAGTRLLYLCVGEAMARAHDQKALRHALIIRIENSPVQLGIFGQCSLRSLCHFCRNATAGCERRHAPRPTLPREVCCAPRITNMAFAASAAACYCCSRFAHRVWHRNVQKLKAACKHPSGAVMHPSRDRMWTGRKPRQHFTRARGARSYILRTSRQRCSAV
jgi:hypothetical protein